MTCATSSLDRGRKELAIIHQFEVEETSIGTAIQVKVRLGPCLMCVWSGLEDKCQIAGVAVCMGWDV